MNIEKVMYEVNWHYTNDTFSGCSVSTITVVWQGLAPGCSMESIIAIDAKGTRFQGSAGDYYETPAAAWAHAKEAIAGTIEANDAEVKRLTEETFHLHKFLCSIPDEINDALAGKEDKG